MTDWRRAAMRRMVWPVLIFVAGAALAIAFDGDVRIIGGGVMGVGVTLFVALVFLEVGYSEDREREGK